MLKLHVTRAKIFIMQTEEGEQRCMLPANSTMANVPDWVKTTLGYEYGVKDGSISDLTPPKKAIALDEPEVEEPEVEEPKAPKKVVNRTPPGIVGATKR